jgi:ATP adenylyltransferase
VTDSDADPIAPSPGICHLCAQIAGDSAADLVHSVLAPAIYRRAVCGETTEFAVIPSIGPLVAGHVLVTPKRHVRSFASLPGWQRDSGDELAARLAADLARVYDQPVHKFEHGSARCGSTIACSVEHAHLHLLPTEAEVWPLIQDAGPWRDLGTQSLATIVAGREYLLYEQPNGERRVWITDETPIASQFMRQAFAAALRIPQYWDWRTHPRREEIRATLARVSQIELGAAPPTSRISVSA